MNSATPSQKIATIALDLLSSKDQTHHEDSTSELMIDMNDGSTMIIEKVHDNAFRTLITKWDEPQEVLDEMVGNMIITLEQVRKCIQLASNNIVKISIQTGLVDEKLDSFQTQPAILYWITL